MSPTGNSSGFGTGLPIWDGSSSDPSSWDNYRYAIRGTALGRVRVRVWVRVRERVEVIQTN